MAVLGDGTNEEREDLQEPLNFTPEQLRKVILYQTEMSPPCTKIKTMLTYFRIPFEVREGKHPTSDYKKIPVLELNDRQINDSHVIMKNLTEILIGVPMTPEEVSWERRITYEFQPAFEVELLGNRRDFAKLWSRATDFIGGWQTSVIGSVTPILYEVYGFLFKQRYPEMQLPSSSFGKDFRAELGDRLFFHGDQPGPIDLSLYGTYSYFTDCTSADRFLSSSGLEEWHERMAEYGDSVLAPSAMPEVHIMRTRITP